MKVKNVSGYWMIDDGSDASGVYVEHSWNTINRLMRAEGFVNNDEVIVGFEATQYGLRMKIEDRT